MNLGDTCMIVRPGKHNRRKGITPIDRHYVDKVGEIVALEDDNGQLTVMLKDRAVMCYPEELVILG